MKHQRMIRSNVHVARKVWGRLPRTAITALREITERQDLSIASGDLCYLDGRWYVNHTGLLRLALRNRCLGIDVQPVRQFCNPEAGRWAFRATVYKTRNCRGFVGYRDGLLGQLNSYAPQPTSPAVNDNRETQVSEKARGAE